MDKLKVVTKEKTYLFRFTSKESAKEWFSLLTALKKNPQIFS
jgi:hypothetical protein